MARVTITDLRERQSEAQAKSEALEAEIKALEDKAHEYACAAQQAAEAGQTDKYIECEREADRVRMEIHVKDAMRKKLNESFSRSEVIAAWDNYILDYTRRYNGLIRKYNKARDDLKRVFDELLEMQREALKWRRYAGELIDIKPATIAADEVYTMFRLPCIPTGHRGITARPAVIDFLYGDESYERLQQITANLRYHTLSLV